MTKLFLTPLLCILITIIILPCNAYTQGNIKKSTVQIEKGKEYKIELPATPSTGYNWSIGSPYDTTILVFKNKIFIPGKDTTLPGKPGTDVFTFKAIDKGNTTVRMVLKKDYARKVVRAEDYEFVINK